MAEKLWQAVNGKKTYLAIAAWAVLSVLHDMEKISPENFEIYQTIILGFGGIGLIHKAEKMATKKSA